MWVLDGFYVFPALFLFILFTYYPFISGIYYSFTDWNGITAHFTGFKNYIDLFQDRSLIKAAQNTLFISFFGLLIGNPLAFLLALALNRPFKTRNMLRTLFYLPAIISLVVVSMIWGNILQYDGAVNTLLNALGLERFVIDWLGNLNTSFYMLILISVWQGTGYGAVIYLAGLQSIPTELYEAGKIDGAHGWKSLRHITIPLLMPTVTIVTFLNLVGSLKFFDIPFVLTNGGPGQATSTLALVIYNFAFRNGTFGYATAAGLLFMILIVIITSIQLSLTRRREVEL